MKLWHMTETAVQSSSTGSKIEGFLSYSHVSDEFLDFAEPLHKSLVSMIKLKANRDIQIFRDRESIKWGDRWEKSIASGLEGASVLFVIATTHYLDSEACRDEFTTFLNAAKATGKDQARRLILPIMPVDASNVFNKRSTDPIARAIAEIQYELVEDAVMDGAGSPKWKHAMRTLTNRFIEVVDAAELALAGSTDDEEEEPDAQGEWLNSPAVTPMLPSMPSGDLIFEGEGTPIVEDERGIIELSVDMTEDLNEVTGLALEMSTNLSRITESVGGIDFGNSTSAKELHVKFQTVAQRMKPHSAALGAGGLAIRKHVTQIDVSLRRLVSLQMSSNANADIDGLRGQLATIQTSLASVNETGMQMDALLESMEGAEIASSAIRKSLQPMRSGLTAFRDAVRIMKSWGPGLLDAGFPAGALAP